MSIRLRLTIWFAAAMGLLLVLFATAVYWQTRRALLSQTDNTLEIVIDQSLPNVSTAGSPGFIDEATVADALANFENDFVMQIVDNEGILFAQIDSHGPGGDEESGSLPLLKPVGQGVTQRINDQSWRIYSRAIEPGIWLQVGQSLDLVEDNLTLLLWQIGITLPLIILLAALCGYFLAWRALKPVSLMTMTARQIGSSDLTRRILHQGPQDEIGELAATLDAMLQRLEDSFEKERRFTGDAAHELLTPLTALTGHIEVTLNQLRAPEAYIRSLTEIKAQVSRLVRLSNDLLLMAHLDHNHEDKRMESLELREFLTVIAEQLAPIANQNEIALEVCIDRPVYAMADFELLTRVFYNLLDNGIKYTLKGGQVVVSAATFDDKVRIEIADTGIGIPADQLEHLFERFYRVDASRARAADSPGGAGLGLAIVEEIVNLHHGTIAVASTPGQGSRFTVELPAASPDSLTPRIATFKAS